MVSKTLEFDHIPQRVVSLVPSVTESLFDLGLGAAVVGITDYCTQPAGKLEHLPRLGGPRNARVAEIIALQPELVIANWEENSRTDVEALEAAGIGVWVMFPRTVRATLDTLYTLANLFRSPAATARVQTLEITVDWAINAAIDRSTRRYFCPLWQATSADGMPWWMTFNDHTYCADILHLAGGENAFAGRERRYPLEADLGLAAPEPAAGRDVRYPRLTLQEIIDEQPEVILLPDEPFVYQAEHRAQLEQLLSDTPAVQNGRIHLIDGSLIAWPGTRLARALQELPALFE